MLVYIVVFDKSAFQINEKLFSDIASYIDDMYVDTHFIFNCSRRDEYAESIILADTQQLPDDFDICRMQVSCCPSMAVSYTHLDVYKRQLLKSLEKFIESSII